MLSGMRHAVAWALCLVLLCGGTAWAAPDTGKPASASDTTLLTLWFDLQESGPVYAPYAFIRHRDTNALVSARKQQLLHELDNLVWHLEQTGKAALAENLGQWRQRIHGITAYRTPGHWGPAPLMASARNGVSSSVVGALGACSVPDWVEIWSGQGVQRVDWQPGMHLSTLTFGHGLLRHTSAQQVTLVLPYGSRVRRGIAAWNYVDLPIAPGVRIVVPLAIDGRVKSWMRRHLSMFLAHVVPGDHCRQRILHHELAHAPN